MSNLRTIAVAAVAAAVLIIGVAAYSFLRPPAEASRPLEALPLATGAAPTAAPPAAPVDGAAQPSAAPAAPVVLQIAQPQSEARFIIDEVLNGAPKTVVGATNQVAGEIAIDPQDPTKTRVGTIQINARTLATDNDFRNRAIKNRILETDQFELITFAPTELRGLPQGGTVGERYTFQIVGDLTVRDVTRSVTFDVTARAASAARVEGTASATIRHADYGLSIPRVPQVASVAEELRLELDFVAEAK